jgi:hypothetical protein
VADRHTWRRIQAALRRLGELMRPTVLRLDAISELESVALDGLIELAEARWRAGQPPILLRSASPLVLDALTAAGWEFTPDLDLGARCTERYAS